MDGMNVFSSIGGPSPSQHYFANDHHQQHFQFNGPFPQNPSTTVLCPTDQPPTFLYYSPAEQQFPTGELTEFPNFPQQPTIIYAPSSDPPPSSFVGPTFRPEFDQQNCVQFYSQPSTLPIPPFQSNPHFPLDGNRKRQRKVGLVKENPNSFELRHSASSLANPTQKQNLFTFTICPECNRRFRQLEAFNAHFESCWVEAVEKEHRQLLLESTFQFSSNERQRQEAELEKHANLPIRHSAENVYIGARNERRKQQIFGGNEEEMVDVEEGDGDELPPRLIPACEEEINEEVIIEQPFPSANLNANQHQILMNSPPKSTARIECPLCGFRLYRHNLAVHLRIHSGELPFPCTYCPRRFRTTSAMKVHHRTHTGERPYKCPFCAYACTTKRNLDRHIGNRHQFY